MKSVVNGARLIPSSIFISSRNIYLHTGKRVAGLKKDPQQVFTSSQGHKYGENAENLQYVKDFLLNKYAINDELILQVLTHKSFGNGIKPHNEKLSAMGSKLLSLFTAKKCIETPQTTNELAINGLNFDVLGSTVSRELNGRLTLGLFARNSNLNKIMFWKPYTDGLNFESSGELKVGAQMIFALIGAVNFVHGKQVAEEFINEKLFESSPSIEKITASIIEEQSK